MRSHSSRRPRFRGFVSALAFLAVLAGPCKAQWIKVNTPKVGRIVSIAAADSLLFVVREGNLLRSDDSGATWTHLLDDGTGAGSSQYINAVAFGRGLLVAGTQDGGALTSADFGDTWSTAKYTDALTRVTSVIVGENGFFVGTWEGTLYRASGVGERFWPESNRLWWKIQCLANRDSVLFVGMKGRGWTRYDYRRAPIFSSTRNQGLTDSANVIAMAYVDTLLFTGTGTGGVFRSFNSGESWAEANTGLTNTRVSALVAIGADLFAATRGGGVFRSADRGGSWTQVNNGIPANANILSLAAAGGILYAGGDSGILYRSFDKGASWTALNAGLVDAYARVIGVRGTQLYVGAIGSGLFRSADQGATWTAIDKGLPVSNVQAFTTMGNDIFVGTEDEGVHRSSDNGVTWVRIDSGWVLKTAFFLRAVDSLLFAGGRLGAFYRSGNRGTTWTSSSPTTGSHDVTAMVRTSEDHLVVGTGAGGVRLYYIGASHWGSDINHGFSGTRVNSIVPSGYELFAALEGGLYHASISSSFWVGIAGGLPDREIQVLSIRGTHLFTGSSDSGVFRTPDKGKNWFDVSEGLIRKSILSFAEVDSTLFAGTAGGGIWRRPFSELTSSGIPTSIAPDRKAESQLGGLGHSKGRIEFVIRQAGPVELSVFDVHGKKVATLLRAVLEQGIHQVPFKESKLGGGIYILQLQASAVRLTRAVVLD